MKKICLCLLLMAALTMSVNALEVPTSTVVQNLNGSQQVVKTYTVSPGVDAQTLIEEPFQLEGFLYTYADIVKEENRVSERQSHTEAVTVETTKKDLNVILEQLAPTMEYDDGDWAGTLALDHTSIQTQAAGYTTGSSTVTATKTIGPLDRNDMSYVPATTVKNGVTLNLSNVEWQVIDTDLVGDALAPSSYQAGAIYSASTSYQVATGYVSTAEYKGTVTASGIESITYTVVYVGTEIVPEPPQPTEPVKQGGPLSGGNAAAIGGTLLVVLLLAALAGGVVWLYLHRQNAYVYVPGDQPRDYKLIAKFRVEPEKPEVQVNEDQIGSSHMIAVEIKKPLAKKLLNQIFTVNHPCGAQRYMVLRDNPSDWHEFPLDNHIEEMEEAT